MMATKTFGRRGAPPSRIAVPAAAPTVRAAAPAIASVPAIAAGQEAETPVVEDMILERNFIADLPLLTVGLIVLLMLIYGAERRLAFDIGKDGQLSIQSLIAFGA